MCGIRQAVHVQLPVEEGNGKPPAIIRTSQVYDGTSEMTIPSRTCLMAENSSSSSSYCTASCVRLRNKVSNYMIKNVNFKTHAKYFVTKYTIRYHRSEYRVHPPHCCLRDLASLLKLLNLRFTLKI